MCVRESRCARWRGAQPGGSMLAGVRGGEELNRVRACVHACVGGEELNPCKCLHVTASHAHRRSYMRMPALARYQGSDCACRVSLRVHERVARSSTHMRSCTHPYCLHVCVCVCVCVSV